jgi:PAS domain S-box-containing protein
MVPMVGSVDSSIVTEKTQDSIGSLTKYLSSTIQTLEQFKGLVVSDDKYRKLLDSSLDGMILLSGTKIIYTNNSEAKLLGYGSASELIGLDISTTLPEEEKERIKQRTLSRQRGEKVPDRYELKLLRKDGKIIEIETATTAITYEGKTAVLAQTRDVTAAKRFERQVMALHDHAASISHTSSMQEVSQSILDVAESVIGFHLGAFLIVEDDDLLTFGSRGALTYDRRIPIMGKVITAKAAREMRAILVNDLRNDADFLRGSMDSLSELAVPVILDGEVVAVLNFESLESDAFDVVDQKLLETLSVHVSSAIYRIHEIDRIKEQEERKSKELMDGANKLVSMVRHDLRGPLQTIQNAAYLMSRRHIEAEEFTKKINDSVAYAVKILDDLKVMMGPQQLKRESVELNDLLKRCLEDAVITPGIDVEARYGAPVVVEVDSYKIRRVMDNLVKNAVEAMPGGGRLLVMVEASGGDAILTVGDTGKGIPDDVALRMFTPFYTTKKVGTGLGLAICKQVVEAHGGRIEFDSKPSGGTVFTVILPMNGSIPIETGSVTVASPDI